MIFAAGLYGFCPVELLQHHDSGKMMGKGHGTHGQAEIGPLLHPGGDSKRRADQKTGAAFAGKLYLSQLIGEGLAGQRFSLRRKHTEPCAFRDPGENQIGFFFQALGDFCRSGIFGQTAFRQLQQGKPAVTG